MQPIYRWLAAPALLLLVILSACGSNAASPPPVLSPETFDPQGVAQGDPVAGEALFHETRQITGQPAAPPCSSCHVVEAGELEIVGPSLVGIADMAGERVGGLSAEEYLYSAIVAPNEHILSGYDAGIMPRTYNFYLTQEQVNDLVAYMLTLEEE